MRPAAPAVWLRAVRPFSFTASVTPVLVGSAAAFYAGVFRPLLFLITLLAAVSIHAATNLVNDYYDHTRGVDADQPIGPGGAIQRGSLSPRTVLAGALVLFSVAAGLGIWLIVVRGWPIVVIGASSIAAGYAYTGGPLPLGYVGGGDVVVFVFMGLVAVAGTYFVQTGMVAAVAVWAGLPVAALVDAILVANNLRDIANDRLKGKRTLATFIGVRATRAHYLALLIVAYASVLAGVALRVLPAAALVVALTLPAAVRALNVVRTETDALVLTRGGLRGTARLHFSVGTLLALALLFSR
jgi:1,4-dihydroxy-2-naphthoate octaprenyltransferase